MNLYLKTIAYFLLLIFSVVLFPTSTFHHHDLTHDTHFFDDTNGLISDHVFEECDFCTVVIPHFLKVENTIDGAERLLNWKLLSREVTSFKHFQFSAYFLRGPPNLLK